MVTLDDDRFGKSGPRTGNKKSSFVETVAALVVGLLVVAVSTSSATGSTTRRRGSRAP